MQVAMTPFEHCGYKVCYGYKSGNNGKYYVGWWNISRLDSPNRPFQEGETGEFLSAEGASANARVAGLNKAMVLSERDHERKSGF